jgi:hypothetical protein
MEFVNAQEALKSLLTENEELGSLEINITSRALKNEEAIGNPDRKDFPLLTGKEVLLQAEIDGYLGQAFTGDPIAYQGNIKAILELPGERPGNYALMVATLNALTNKMGRANKTIHCLNNEPEDCAKKICQEVIENHGYCKIGIIGYQPAILEHCAQSFGAENVMITDLDRGNVGDMRYGVKVMDGFKDTEKLVDFADVILVTGTILANGTDKSVLMAIQDKPFYFFGTTCAGLAYINDYKRLCPLSK